MLLLKNLQKYLELLSVVVLLFWRLIANASKVNFGSEKLLGTSSTAAQEEVFFGSTPKPEKQEVQVHTAMGFSFGAKSKLEGPKDSKSTP